MKFRKRILFGFAALAVCASFHFTIAIYDTDTQTLYFAKQDT